MTLKIRILFNSTAISSTKTFYVKQVYKVNQKLVLI